MKLFKCLAVAFLLFASAMPCHAADRSATPLAIMTFNIRYNNPEDGENAWPNRKDIAASMIRYHGADIAGLQEALKGQVDDLAERLPEYAWFGVGRDDGKEAGEFMAVFFRKDRLELLDSATFWLSPTPEKPGLGWDAACNRVVTWGKFRDKTTGATFFHFNTHFDHKGETARRESAELLLAKIVEIAGGSPVTVTGDFNADPDSEPIGILTGVRGTNTSCRLTDSITVSRTRHHGPSGTWTAFSSPGAPGDKPIDFVFIKNGVGVLKHATLSDTFDGRFPSDHMPVFAVVTIPKR